MKTRRRLRRRRSRRRRGGLRTSSTIRGGVRFWYGCTSPPVDTRQECPRREVCVRRHRESRTSLSAIPVAEVRSFVKQGGSLKFQIAKQTTSQRRKRMEIGPLGPSKLIPDHQGDDECSLRGRLAKIDRRERSNNDDGVAEGPTINHTVMVVRRGRWTDKRDRIGQAV